jgi:hypothetical protein
MRAFVVAGLVLSAALAGGAGAGSGAESQVRPGTPTVLTGYRLTAQLQASLFVGWSDTRGDPDAACSSWVTQTGTSRVDAHTAPIRGFLQLHPPGTTHVVIRGRRVPVTWAELSAVGRATGTAKRTYTHTAGVNWSAECVGSRPIPERAPATDCDPRTFTTRTAAIIATDRAFNRTLESGNANPGPGDDLGSLRSRSIDFIISPSRDLFRSCPPATAFASSVELYARRYITDVGLLVTDEKWQKLRRLRSGGRLPLSHIYGGRCDTHISPRDCSFRLELDVWIKRVG